MTDNVPGTVLNVSCPSGQKLTNGQNMMTAVCSRTGNWIPEIPGCAGGTLVFCSYAELRFIAFLTAFLTKFTSLCTEYVQNCHTRF